MVARQKLDSMGRIVIPKPVRDDLGLMPGDSVELERSETGLTLRPARDNPPLRQKRGVWVFGTGEPLAARTIDETLSRVRGERNSKALRGRP